MDLPPASDSRPDRHLALGVLAHVDAGKTSLTEALLVAGGALERPGRVDDGTTQTDTLALERRRGITIRTAVATFRAGDVLVDLVDTPGHPDFVAEVDRSLSVLDGAVLVVSAVEGVQAQTVVLHRALRRLRVPTVVFVNKVDRAGADPVRVVAGLAHRLDVALLSLGTPVGAGGPAARFVPDDWHEPAVAESVTAILAEHDEALLARWLERGRPEAPTLREALGRLTRAAVVQPLLLGSARTGAGVPELVASVADLLVPEAPLDADAPLVGQVFKVEHDGPGRRLCTVRLRAGTLAVRDRVRLGGAGRGGQDERDGRDGREGVVTGIQVFAPGGPVQSARGVAGEVVRVSGLAAARVGDRLADRDARDGGPSGWAPAFPPPALQTTVAARDPQQQGALHRALVELADGDPLIRLRPDPRDGALRIDVYGDVQREVLAETLTMEHGVEADFSPTAAACVERPAGPGAAVRRMGDAGHLPLVTLGVTVAPSTPGAGVELRVAADRLTLPLHVYGTVEALRTALREHAVDALAVGPRGWPVVDVVITLVESGYPPAGPAPADVRRTFVDVVREALVVAGTVVCEPVEEFRLETPTDTAPAVLGLLLRHRAVVDGSAVRAPTTVLTGTVPAVEVDPVRRGLPTAAHGLAALESWFDHHAPAPPQRG